MYVHQWLSQTFANETTGKGHQNSHGADPNDSPLVSVTCVKCKFIWQFKGWTLEQELGFWLGLTCKASPSAFDPYSYTFKVCSYYNAIVLQCRYIEYIPRSHHSIMTYQVKMNLLLCNTEVQQHCMSVQCGNTVFSERTFTVLYGVLWSLKLW